MKNINLPKTQQIYINIVQNSIMIYFYFEQKNLNI